MGFCKSFIECHSKENVFACIFVFLSVSKIFHNVVEAFVLQITLIIKQN